MNHYIITSPDSGIRIDGPLTRDEVAERLRPGSGGEEHLTCYGDARDITVLDKVPTHYDGHFAPGRKIPVLILRAEVVGLDEINLCPCQSGKAFRDCHGQDAEPATCAHEKVYAGHVLTSYPPQHPWVCAKCKARGADSGGSVDNGSRYQELMAEPGNRDQDRAS